MYQVTVDRKSGDVAESGDLNGLIDMMVEFTAAKMGVRLIQKCKTGGRTAGAEGGVRDAETGK